MGSQEGPLYELAAEAYLGLASSLLLKADVYRVSLTLTLTLTSLPDCHTLGRRSEAGGSRASGR